jgi:hypothetical protein
VLRVPACSCEGSAGGVVVQQPRGGLLAGMQGDSGEGGLAAEE